MRILMFFVAFAAGCGSPPPERVGDFCLDLAPIVCEVADSCFDQRDPNCVNEFVAGCCGDEGTCANPTRDISRRDYNCCLNDLEDRTCAQWSNLSAFPASCQTL